MIDLVVASGTMLLLQDSPCVPLKMTVAQQWHGYDSQGLRPRRRLTAIWMASLDRDLGHIQ